MITTIENFLSNKNVWPKIMTLEELLWKSRTLTLEIISHYQKYHDKVRPSVIRIEYTSAFKYMLQSKLPDCGSEFHATWVDGDVL